MFDYKNTVFDHSLVNNMYNKHFFTDVVATIVLYSKINRFRFRV